MYQVRLSFPENLTGLIRGIASEKQPFKFQAIQLLWYTSVSQYQYCVFVDKTAFKLTFHLVHSLQCDSRSPDNVQLHHLSGPN